MPHRVRRAAFKEELFHPDGNLMLHQVGADYGPHRILCQSASVHLPVDLGHAVIPAAAEEADPSSICLTQSDAEESFHRRRRLVASFKGGVRDWMRRRTIQLR